VGTGVETSVNQIFEHIKAASGKDIQKIHAGPRKGEIKRSCISPEKITQLTGWTPSVSIEDGIKRTFNWFSSQV